MDELILPKCYCQFLTVKIFFFVFMSFYPLAQILTYESNEIITTCANRYVELTCEVKNTSPLCGKVELFWRRGDETLVICTKAGVCEGTFSAIAPFFQYQVISNQPDYKLVHLTVKVFNETKGEFSCSPGKEGEAKVIVDVDNSRGNVSTFSTVHITRLAH